MRVFLLDTRTLIIFLWESNRMKFRKRLALFFSFFLLLTAPPPFVPVLKRGFKEAMTHVGWGGGGPVLA